jgi:hypothetical protein
VPKRVSLKGKGAELFFGDYPAVADADATPAADHREGESGETATVSGPLSLANSVSELAPEADPVAPPAQPKTSRRPARPSTKASKPDDELASALASVDTGTVETIRQVIKVPGREVSYLRLTPEEKADLSDIVYTYKRQGQKTSETEINRIALNYLLLDYREHGQQSVLARVLAALLA